MPPAGEHQLDAQGPFTAEFMGLGDNKKEGTEVYHIKVTGQGDASHIVERRYTCFQKFSAVFRETYPSLPAMPSKSIFKNLVPGFMEARSKALKEILDAALEADPNAGTGALKTFLALKGGEGVSEAPPPDEDALEEDSAFMRAFVSDAQGGLSAKRIAKPDLPSGYNILVKNAACSMNPIDLKAGKNALGMHPAGTVLGYDSVGFVEAVGHMSTLFKKGDRVWFSGSLQCAGTNAEYTVVDERLVAFAPNKLSDAEAAAVPLVGLTAFEGLSEKLELSTPQSIGKTILVLPGAGGVGSICVQLAKKVFNMVVIATASREETSEYCRKMGADHIINHKEPMRPQLEKLGFSGVDYIFNAFDTVQNFTQFCDIINPMGGIVSIVETNGVPLDIGALMMKRASFSWELMFQRSLMGEESDRICQHNILTQLAYLYDAGVLQSIQTQELKMDENGLREARTIQDSGQALGKTSLVW